MADLDLSAIPNSPLIGGRKTTADYIAAALRDAINQGSISDNTILNQAAIASHFGVSRVPVREAMRQLQAEGLIESQAHHLAVVRGTNFQQLHDVFSLRALIEGWLMGQAVAAGIDESRIERARALNEKLRTEEDHSHWLKLNTEFHLILYEAADNDVALEVLEPLRERSRRYTQMWSKGVGNVHYPLEASKEHDEILQAAIDGDPVKTQQLTEAHVLRTRDRVLDAGKRIRALEKGIE